MMRKIIAFSMVASMIFTIFSPLATAQSTAEVIRKSIPINTVIEYKEPRIAFGCRSLVDHHHLNGKLDVEINKPFRYAEVTIRPLERKVVRTCYPNHPKARPIILDATHEYRDGTTVRWGTFQQPIQFSSEFLIKSSKKGVKPDFVTHTYWFGDYEKKPDSKGIPISVSIGLPFKMASVSADINLTKEQKFEVNENDMKKIYNHGDKKMHSIWQVFTNTRLKATQAKVANSNYTQRIYFEPDSNLDPKAKRTFQTKAVIPLFKHLEGDKPVATVTTTLLSVDY